MPWPDQIRIMRKLHHTGDRLGESWGIFASLWPTRPGLNQYINFTGPNIKTTDADHEHETSLGLFTCTRILEITLQKPYPDTLARPPLTVEIDFKQKMKMRRGGKANPPQPALLRWDGDMDIPRKRQKNWNTVNLSFFCVWTFPRYI